MGTHTHTHANITSPCVGVEKLRLCISVAEKYFLSWMTQWENVFVMKGLLCSGKVNYTANLPHWLLVQNRTVDTDMN